MNSKFANQLYVIRSYFIHLHTYLYYLNIRKPPYKVCQFNDYAVVYGTFIFVSVRLGFLFLFIQRRGYWFVFVCCMRVLALNISLKSTTINSNVTWNTICVPSAFAEKGKEKVNFVCSVRVGRYGFTMGIKYLIYISKYTNDRTMKPYLFVSME